MDRPARIAVIGVGNPFRRDDGVGPEVVRRLRKRAWHSPLPPNITLADCDGDPGRLISLWEGMDLAVVIDAAHAHPGHPGRVHRLTRYRPFGVTEPASSHGLGLGDAVQLADALGTLPRLLVVLAVEGADSGPGHGLSPEVAAAVGPLIREVEEQIGVRAEAVVEEPSATARAEGARAAERTEGAWAGRMAEGARVDAGSAP